MLGSRASQTRTPAQRKVAARPRPRQRDTVQPVRTRIRPFALLAIMSICTAGLVARLIYWQVLQHGQLAAMARSEYAALNLQTPLRGQIYDANGITLATDVTQDIVSAVPAQVKDPTRTARLMAPVLHQSERTVYNLITGDAQEVLLAPSLSAQDGQKVKDLALPGIILDAKSRRAYPRHSFASQVLGFTNDNLQGQYGVEGYYDSRLAGTAGLRSVLKDTAGNDIRVSSAAPSPMRNGADLHLTIDSAVQGVVEDELNKGIKAHGAISGTAIVMDPRTGYILGMASSPTFDPNHFSKYSPSTYTNPAIQWMYEPGSTLKIITMAAGLDTGVITPRSAFEDTGSFVVGNDTIHNWNGLGFGYENMTQVLQHSANVGASWVAEQLGIDRYYTYAKRFMLNQPTGVDLQGEESGIMPFPGDKNWSIVNLYTNSFGQGLLISPLRLMTSVGAVANGGVMMKPQIVKRMVYDGRIIDHQPVSQGRVISARTSHTLTDMLVHSAVGGEASEALIKGYNIAAKTGTANVADGHGGYLKNATIASIVGYAPAYHPRFLIEVILNRPRDIWGSVAAAPVMHNMLVDLFRYYHIPPSPYALNK